MRGELNDAADLAFATGDKLELGQSTDMQFRQSGVQIPVQRYQVSAFALIDRQGVGELRQNDFIRAQPALMRQVRQVLKHPVIVTPVFPQARNVAVVVAQDIELA